MNLDAVWVAYELEVIPEGASEIQVRETKRAFYAGIHALLEILAQRRLLHPRQVRDIVQEWQEFADDVCEGRQ